ncbi:MAG TPA: hypothetical protein VHD88_04960 [Pyrinomonadaceae bacterium]|nr:hypothetical protein [Pyrinomonadaceae bacterium]
MVVRIVIVLCLLLAVGSASTQSKNLLKNPTGEEGLQSWRVFGNASVSDCFGAGKCFSIHEDGYILQDINISESAVGMFAVLIGFASIEETNPDGSLGHPYLYGYMMNPGEPRGGTIFSYLTGQEMANRPSASGEWAKQYGVFKVPEKTGRIRMFFRSGCPKTQTSTNCVSRFREPGVFLFGTEDEAKAFISGYQ